MNYKEAMQHCILRFVSGSQAYGTSTPESDTDYRGVFIAPLHYAFDLFHSSFVSGGTLADGLKGVVKSLQGGDTEAALKRIHQLSDVDQGDLNMSVGTVSNPDCDEELQELRKFLKLAAECNPNIVEFLFVEKGITHETEVWRKIKARRHLFVTKRARHTFSGYAIAQLHRIKGHRGYLMNPPDHRPARAEFGLPEESTIAKENQNAVLSLAEKWITEECRKTVLAEKAYQAANDKWKAYEKWKRERNPKRQEIEAKWGYDTKHAAHLVRLLRMGKEILETGQVHVHRPDAAELLSIRNGAWPYEKVVEYAEQMDAHLGELYATSALQNKPDYSAISDLYVEICEEHYGIRIKG